MRATRLWPATLLLAGLSAYPAVAGVIWCAPALHRPLGHAPDATGPGYYWTDLNGVTYGPAYYLVPPFPPVQGVRPGQKINTGPGQLTSHGHGYGQQYPPGMGQGYHPGYAYGGHPHGMGAQPGAVPYPPHPGHPPTGIPSPPSLPNPGKRPHDPPQKKFYSHPFIRSPRDFFMWNEVVEDELSRYQLPTLVP